MTPEQKREIRHRAHEIRYGEGCSWEKAIRWATEEWADWDELHNPKVTHEQGR